MVNYDVCLLHFFSAAGGVAAGAEGGLLGCAHSHFLLVLILVNFRCSLQSWLRHGISYS
jgi:hypothetical protein